MFDLAVLRRQGRLVPLLEFSVEVQRDETLVRLAPGLYWQPRCTNAELGVSPPIGLTADAPDLAVFVLLTMEFGGPGEESHAGDDNE